MRGVSRWLATCGLLCLACPAPESNLSDPTDGSSSSDTAATSTSGTTMGSGSPTGPASTGSSSSTDTSTTSVDSETGDPTCPEPHRCIEAIPEDWTGPVARVAQLFGAEPALCTAPYAASAVTLFDDPLGTPATCTCTCGSGTGQVCGATLLQDFEDMCDGFPIEQYQVVGTSCESIFGGDYYWAETLEPTGGTCPTSLQVETTDPAWDTRMTACSPLEVDGSACGDQQLCAPPPPEGFDDALCIYRQGDVDCPDGSEYSERTVYFGDFTDTRDCIDDCQCSEATGGTCSGVVLLHSDNSCENTVDFVPADGMTCIEDFSFAASASFQGGASGGSCTPSGGTPTGEVTGDVPVTFCCG